MNSHQRRKFAVEKHMRMPLGCDVVVSCYRGHRRTAQLVKHDSQRPNTCIVRFTDIDCKDEECWISLYRVRPVLRQKIRPWWRSRYDKVTR